jgi:hypothetical protein
VVGSENKFRGDGIIEWGYSWRGMVGYLVKYVEALNNKD